VPDDLIVTVAGVGAETTRAHNPALPHTPDEIAEDARRCADAGAAIYHLHCRSDDGEPTQDPQRFRDCVAAIRGRCDIVVQVSTGGAVWMGADERLGSLEARPEMASLTCGTTNFGQAVFSNPAPLMLDFARRMTALRVKPELEIFDLGHLDNAAWLCAKAPLPGPQHYDLVLGVPGALAGLPRNLCALTQRLPAGSTWTATGVGRSHLPVALTALAEGGGVRCGLEDQVEYLPGRLARGNAELVERIVRLGGELGRPAASPARAREILGLTEER
jgi:3-keto-5-aminohexanoate cleavage enzyme